VDSKIPLDLVFWRREGDDTERLRRCRNGGMIRNEAFGPRAGNLPGRAPKTPSGRNGYTNTAEHEGAAVSYGHLTRAR
jgi:hypothetical protein